MVPNFARLALLLLCALLVTGLKAPTPVVTVEELCAGAYDPPHFFNPPEVAIRERPLGIYSCTEKACGEANPCCNTCEGILGFTCPPGTKYSVIELRAGAPDAWLDDVGADAGVEGNAGAPRNEDFKCAGDECNVTCTPSATERSGVRASITHAEGTHLILHFATLLDRDDPQFTDPGGCGCGQDD